MGRALRHRSNEGSHYQNSLERERGIQGKIGRGRVYTQREGGREGENRNTDEHACTHTKLQDVCSDYIGWREEEEEEGQKESRGRNEGGREKFYNEYPCTNV